MTPQPDAILNLFQEKGAYLQGHFKLSSGLHSPEYLQCALVLQYPDAAAQLGAGLAARVREIAGRQIDLVASPALGGLIIGHEVARALGTRFIFTERDASSGKMVFRRGFTISPGEKAVVIEDVITTGGSTLDVVTALKEAGASVVAAGSVIDRSGGKADVSVPRAALATLQVETYRPEGCPLCAAGSLAVKPGSRPA
jgi:orotate phosphoribosyltransferase